MTLSLSTSWDHMGTATVTRSDDAGTRYLTWHDEDAECPTGNYGNDVALSVYSTSSRGSIEWADDLFTDVFRAAYDRMDASDALTITRRYARVFLGWTAEEAESRIDTYSARGYSQSDWWDILVVVNADGYGDAVSHAEEWQAWARGDIYGVTVQERIECENPDDCHGDEDCHWENTDSIGGIYADSAEEAAEYYANEFA